MSHLEIQGQEVTAVVQGSHTYYVALDSAAEGEAGSCDCSAFSHHGPCKHMWAVALAADEEMREAGLLEEALPDPDADPDASAEWPPKGKSPKRKSNEESPREEVKRLLGLHDLEGHGAEDASADLHTARPAEETWETRVSRFKSHYQREKPGVWEQALQDTKRIEYVLDIDESMVRGSPSIRVFHRTRKKNGGFGTRRDLKLNHDGVAVAPDPEDKRILELLGPHAVGRDSDGYRYTRYGQPATSLAAIGLETSVPLMERMAATGRLLLLKSGHESDGGVVRWDHGEPWRLRLRLEPGKVDRRHVVTLTGDLVRGSEAMPLEEPHILFSFGVGTGVIIYGTTVATFDPRGAMNWVVELRGHGPLVVPKAKAKRLAESLAETAYGAWEPAPVPVGPPRVSLEIGAEELPDHYDLPCTLTMTYGDGVQVDPFDIAGLVPTTSGEGWLRRDVDFEVAAVKALHHMGATPPDEALYPMASDSGSLASEFEGPWHGRIRPSEVPKIVDAALSAGWSVRAEGNSYRTAGGFRGAVTSGVDWFDLNAELEFDGEAASLPAILRAAREGRSHVALGDGSFGVLPQDWLKSWGLLELAGTPEGDALRFDANQGWILDALLAGRGAVTGDEGFEGYRARLDGFSKVQPSMEPRSFKGELRPYQRFAVGWFRFLRELGLGGCLADDMGLGKTVQVLALLEERRLGLKEIAGGHRPTLVVAPSSLVFNWLAEAARFAPKLRALDYTGADRAGRAGDLTGHDLVVTTYGTLRRDAVKLAKVEFDYVVLDEATAIKNASSQAAKAARVLRARHRLALSGTPIENHLGELWSLLEFLNPGMLGSSTAFKRFSRAGRSAEDLAALSRALAPFFLRRTKKEVLTDLPEKTEQIIMCEMSGAERKRYDEVRQHFRAQLLGGGGAADQAVGTDRIQVLEALLRLRQCACHPALLDESLGAEPSAKLDELLPRLEELVAEGHKVLVFSQFTSFLKVLRARLDTLGIEHEYLDGSTRKRKEKVERFQGSDECRLFLISIKAGGHGLNLTAADYVFILDPWWNPAVEAQAVDRAHRMGQQRPVFAYRLVARDTVEEKVLELQAKKRELAEAIIGEGAGVLQDLTRGDLELLLS